MVLTGRQSSREKAREPTVERIRAALRAAKAVGRCWVAIGGIGP